VGEQEAADQACQRRRQNVVNELGEQTRQQRHFVEHDLRPPPVFFKRTNEFQTGVHGGGAPGKRKFCGSPGDFLRRNEL
jgi:hypothetical protein